MFGLLFKLVLIGAVLGGIFGFVYLRRGSLPDLAAYSDPKRILAEAQKTGLSEIGRRMSRGLDDLITHPDRNSPIVLGSKISSDSLNAVIDVIQKLPPDQVSTLKLFLCSPASDAATPSTGN